MAVSLHHVRDYMQVYGGCYASPYLHVLYILTYCDLLTSIRGTYYFEPQATNILQLAVGQVIELGLHKAPALRNKVQCCLVDEATAILKGIKANATHSLEEIRAMLGCFYIASMCVIPILLSSSLRNLVGN